MHASISRFAWGLGDVASRPRERQRAACVGRPSHLSRTALAFPRRRKLLSTSTTFQVPAPEAGNAPGPVTPIDISTSPTTPRPDGRESQLPPPTLPWTNSREAVTSTRETTAEKPRTHLSAVTGTPACTPWLDPPAKARLARCGSGTADETPCSPSRHQIPPS